MQCVQSITVFYCKCESYLRLPPQKKVFTVAFVLHNFSVNIKNLYVYGLLAEQLYEHEASFADSYSCYFAFETQAGQQQDNQIRTWIRHQTKIILKVIKKVLVRVLSRCNNMNNSMNILDKTAPAEPLK